MNTSEKLAALNAFRATEGKAPFADWRNARHQPMLDAYQAMQDAIQDSGDADNLDGFEASAEELAAQTVRPVADYVPSEGAEIVADVQKEMTATESALSAAVHSGDFAGNKAIQEAATELAKTKSYKEVARYAKSSVDKPVGFVHQFLSDNPGMSRKEAVIALTDGYGVNYSTARTQYQRWFTAQKKGV